MKSYLMSLRFTHFLFLYRQKRIEADVDLNRIYKIGLYELENKAGYTVQDAPSMRSFHLRK